MHLRIMLHHLMVMGMARKDFYVCLEISFGLYSLLVIDINICRHTASIAAGNHGIPVLVAGHHFGNASGMAPRSQ